MDLMQVISETPALKGTFIYDLFQAMSSNQVGEEAELVAPGEKVIGEMNELEKALEFLREKYSKKESEIVYRFRGETEPVKPEEKIGLENELRCYRKRFEIADTLLWENITTRLADLKDPLSTGWGIRLNNQIVLMFERPPIRELLGLAFIRGMMED